MPVTPRVSVGVRAVSLGHCDQQNENTNNRPAWHDWHGPDGVFLSCARSDLGGPLENSPSGGEQGSIISADKKPEIITRFYRVTLRGRPLQAASQPAQLPASWNEHPWNVSSVSMLECAVARHVNVAFPTSQCRSCRLPDCQPCTRRLPLYLCLSVFLSLLAVLYAIHGMAPRTV